MQESYNKSPLLSIGMPTYKRPALLRRALKSIVNQSYTNYEIIISDNDPNENEVELIVSELKDLGIAVIYEKQKITTPPTDNFFNCLNKANGKLFMWLADDDEIADHEYIKNLVKILTDNPTASTAMANWVLMRDAEYGESKGVRDYQSNFWFFRVIKFTLFSSDDFFYGMHRTEFLKKARRLNYFWPNKGQVINWAYPFLMDMVIQGEIIGTHKKNIQWIDHHYTAKGYIKNNKENYSFRILMFALRRINVHYLYYLKVQKAKGVIYAIFLIPFSLLSLALESARLLQNFLQKKFKFFPRF
jgi:glycosyltransferase involved in cell wall biosynthesis